MDGAGREGCEDAGGLTVRRARMHKNLRLGRMQDPLHTTAQQRENKRMAGMQGETGGGADSRREEASKICIMLTQFGVEAEMMTEREAEFIDEIEDPGVPVSPKQLFWLRDIKDKYL